MAWHGWAGLGWAGLGWAGLSSNCNKKTTEFAICYLVTVRCNEKKPLGLIYQTSKSYTLSKEQRHARPHRYLTKSVLSTPYHIHRAAIFSMHENA